LGEGDKISVLERLAWNDHVAESLQQLNEVLKNVSENTNMYLQNGIQNLITGFGLIFISKLSV
jgi:hypothetical protein